MTMLNLLGYKASSIKIAELDLLLYVTCFIFFYIYRNQEAVMDIILHMQSCFLSLQFVLSLN